MKKLVVSAIAIMILASCGSLNHLNVFHTKIKDRSEVNKDSVPPVIVQAFQDKYLGIAPEKWYKVSRNKYAARFNKSGTTAYAFFSTKGVFWNEEVDDQDYYDPYDDLDPTDRDMIDEY